MKLEVRDHWDGRAGSDVAASFVLSATPGGLSVAVSAPHRRDPAPEASAGRTDELWQHEVVELFLLGADDRYLEIELGPHGHWLALALHGSRRVVDDRIRLDPVWTDASRVWSAELRVPHALLPPAVARVNAFAIYGQGAARVHRAWCPADGDRPDFHRLDAFGPLDENLRAALQ